MKFVNNTTLRITTSGKIFEHPKEFPSEQDYCKGIYFGEPTPKATQDLRLLSDRIIN